MTFENKWKNTKTKHKTEYIKKSQVDILGPQHRIGKTQGQNGDESDSKLQDEHIQSEQHKGPNKNKQGLGDL